MKTRKQWICLLLVFAICLGLCACAADEPGETTGNTPGTTAGSKPNNGPTGQTNGGDPLGTTGANDATVPVKPTDSTDPTDNEPPATDPAGTEPPATQVPTTGPTETQAPTTEPTETQKPTTEPTETQKPTTKPTETQKPTTKPTETQKPTTEPSTQTPTTEPPAVPDPGTLDNPVDLVMGSNTAKTTGKGGYYLCWTAEKDGTLTLNFTSSSWAYEIYNLTAGDALDQISKSTDEYPNSYAQIPVLKGDQLLIAINTSGGTAGTVKFAASFGEELIGTAENPYHVTVGSTTAIRVPAGKTAYFSGRVHGLTMAISNAGNAKVTFGGKDYSPKNGKITIELPYPDMAGGMRELLTFAIANNSSNAQVVTVDFTVPAGHSENPAELVLGSNSASIKENDPDGYLYSWTAPADGTLSITMPNGDWGYVIHNITTYQYGEFHYSNDKPVMNIATITVKAGDVLQISVSTFDPKKPNNTPAGTVEFTASFE